MIHAIAVAYISFMAGYGSYLFFYRLWAWILKSRRVYKLDARRARQWAALQAIQKDFRDAGFKWDQDNRKGH